MPDDEQLLSQEQIDAMLSGAFAGGDEDEDTPAFGENPVRLKATSMEEIRAKSGTPTMKKASPAPMPEAEAPEPAPAPAAAPANNAEIEKLAKRVAKLEAALKNQSGPCEGHAQMQEDLRTLASQIKAVTEKVDSIINSLQGTVGFGARETFVCKTCQSKGRVAARLNCTACGDENWWGWWPNS